MDPATLEALARELDKQADHHWRRVCAACDETDPDLLNERHTDIGRSRECWAWSKTFRRRALMARRARVSS